jgi:protein-S-isoprenylcysteine O-methyltransferase Ste14
MELIPSMRIGWVNGWIPLGLLFLVQGLLLVVFPKEVVARLFDRSLWDSRQRAWTAAGKLFSLACLILLFLTPLKIGSPILLTTGAAVHLVGLAGLVVSLFNFRNTPLDEPVSRGLYRISRHPQIVALFVVFLGACLTIGSWIALFMLLASRLMQHFSILAEEEACLAQYGDSYRAYMNRVPRYFLFF